MSDSLSPLFTWRSAITSSSSDLSSTERLVCFVLSLYMNERGSSCFPAVPTIAEGAGLGERAVQNALRSIEAKGWLEVARSNGGKRGSTNTYRATFPQAILEGVHEVHRSQAEGVHETTARGARRAPDLVKDFDKDKDRARTRKPSGAELAATEYGSRLLEAEELVERLAFHYADDRPAFARELARYRLSDGDLEKLRGKGQRILRAAEERGEA